MYHILISALQHVGVVMPPGVGGEGRGVEVASGGAVFLELYRTKGAHLMVASTQL